MTDTTPTSSDPQEEPELLSATITPAGLADVTIQGASVTFGLTPFTQDPVPEDDAE